jgi:hypothetical protein
MNTQFRRSSDQTVTSSLPYTDEYHIWSYSATLQGLAGSTLCHLKETYKNIKEICTLIAFRIHYQQVHCLKYIFILLCFWSYEIILQNWGNYSDMSQGLVIYIVSAADVLLICSFGTQLTQYVRICVLFLYLTRYVHNVQDAHRHLWKASNSVYYTAFAVTLNSKTEIRFQTFHNILYINHKEYSFYFEFLLVPSNYHNLGSKIVLESNIEHFMIFLV